MLRTAPMLDPLLLSQREAAPRAPRQLMPLEEKPVNPWAHVSLVFAGLRVGQ